MATVRHLSLLTFITLILSVQSTLILEPTDHKALLTLHKALGISTNSTSICNTTGIFCERRISNTTTVLKVTRIVLNHRRLRGSISPAIGKLSELKELILSNNHLVNQIPVQISSCRKLEVLDVKNNRFSGSVPVQLSSLNRLRILDLSSNKFSGDLNFLKYFPNLEKLSLANNMFTGKIPVSIRSFRNLRFFNISGNSFLEGPVPTINKLENVPKRYSFAESESPSIQIQILQQALMTSWLRHRLRQVHQFIRIKTRRRK
ncbi:putative transferase [Helianthus annuus]|nr:putative transferase [Helianthus annuus]